MTASFRVEFEKGERHYLLYNDRRPDFAMDAKADVGVDGFHWPRIRFGSARRAGSSAQARLLAAGARHLFRIVAKAQFDTDLKMTYGAIDDMAFDLHDLEPFEMTQRFAGSRNAMPNGIVDADCRCSDNFGDTVNMFGHFRPPEWPPRCGHAATLSHMAERAQGRKILTSIPGIF